MSQRHRTCWRAAWLACLLPGLALAHSFSTPYVLPIPYWIYVYGCAATLVVTFAVLGFFASEPVSPASSEARASTSARLIRLRWPWVLPLLRAGALFCLLLTILSGFVGVDDPGRNIGMTMFWVIFLLGFAYLTLLIGDVYALINPWKTVVAWLERIGLDLSTARVAYPQRLSYWPAFLFYMALIWIELFFEQKPSTLSIILIVYSTITLIGVALFGKSAWFSRADLFSNYFGVIGKLAPVEYVEAPREPGLSLRLRAPFSGAVNDRPEHVSLVLFVLFMLSSTTYDAVYETQAWTALFWQNAMLVLQPLWGTDLGKAQGMLMSSFLVYRKAGLLVFPFLYLGVYLLALLAARVVSRTTVASRTLALDFCYSLMPIAFAYNFTHYYTFLVAQVRVLPWLLTDPFGLGWNLFGLQQDPQNATSQMGVIWHVQVIVILIGHVASVIVAHRVATRTFATRGQVLASQLPLLVLMVAYTTLGLWVLTLPLG